MSIQKLAARALVLTLFAPVVAFGQEAGLDTNELMQAFARRAEDDRVELTVIHLNDLTTDALFEAPAKYSLRAQARGATMFFVQGAAKEDMVVNFEFVLVANRTIPMNVVNVSNFAPGTELSAGDTFTGIVALDEPLNFRTPFVLGIDDWRFDYEFSPNIISQLEAGAGE